MHRGMHHAKNLCAGHDPILQKIDDNAKEKGISRAQWACTAIDFYLNQGGADLENLHHELDQARTEREQDMRESVQLRRSEEHLRTEVDQLRSKLEKAQRELEQALSDSTESKAVQERCKIDTEKALEALKLKDSEIDFLRGHVSQLTQSISQLSLKPGEEEIKKKGWWQFWR